MTGAELAALVTAAATLVTAVGSLVVALRNSSKLNSVHAAVNGQTDALVELTASSSFAEGVDAQRQVSGDVGKFPTRHVGETTDAH
jgi:hypothetical protein